VPYAHTARIEIYYERFGSGPPLLFISGTGGDLRVRPGVLDTPLAAQFGVVAFDQRGLGRSAKPAGPYTMLDYALDALALMDTLDLGRVCVIGVSFGGMVAQELALLAPQRIERLVLCCTSAGGAGGASYPLQALAALPDAERTALRFELGDRRHTAAWRAANPEIVARIEAQAAAAAAVSAADPEGPRGAALQLAARADHDTFARLPMLQMPTLLCAGRYDGIAPLANMEAMARQLPNAELRVYEGGHLFLVQDRTANPDIAAWLLH
jgi:3-oxoadipate enol-lactonase